MLMWKRRFVELYPELSRLMVPGTTAEELFRERIRSDAVGELEFPVDEYVRRRMEMRKLGGGAPFVHRHRDGRWFRTTERKTSEGGIVATTTDVTELKNSETDLRAAKEQAELANRAKSEFLANMSHEIRKPMNGVLGMASILLESDLTPDQKKHAEIIKQSGTSLLSILNDILDLSKVEAGHVVIENLDFDLQDLLGTVEAVWQSRLESNGLDFLIEVEPQVDTVLRSDPTRIRQILVNLISNGAKFTETGGIKIGVSQCRHSDTVLETRFEVTDTGIGITPTAQPLIFSKFAQADSSTTRKYGGTGLGLAISQQLAELLGGEMGFDSVEGEGSTFWFTIRSAPGNRAAVRTDIYTREIDQFQSKDPVRSLKILVAEDNSVNQAVIRALLDKAGHRFDIVGNGLEAVSAVMAARYDLVLMDIQMPEMDGVTATQEIRNLPGKTGRVPIIALTANAMKGDRETYLEAGMTDYVPNPIDPNELVAAIARNRIDAETADNHKSDSPAVNDIGDAIPVLDLNILETLSEAVGEEVMPDLIEESVQEMREILRLIVTLGDGADLAALRGAAHDLKSSSGGFGAARLQRFAQDLEWASRDNRPADARKLAGEISPVGDEAFETLEAYAIRGASSAIKRAVND